MSDMEAKIRITAENNAAAGLNSAAADVNSAAGRINNSGAEMQRAMSRVMQDVGDKLGEVNSSVKKGFEQMADNIGDAAKKAESEIGRIGEGLGRLQTMLLGFFSVAFARELMQTADAMAVLNNQVRNVTDGEAEYAAVKRELLDLSNRTSADIESTTDLYVKSRRALKDYGYSQQEVLKFTEATANAMTIGGVGAQQQAAALMQLSQALGSGVLQGDEFKSIAEAAPILLDTIAEYMGKSRAEIKKLGSEGKLTAEIVFNAISGASEKLAEQAAKMSSTMGRALTVFSNNWKTFTDGILNSTGVMNGAAAVIKLVAENLKFVVPIVAGLAAGVAAAIAPTLAATAAAWGLNAALLANPVTLVVAGIGLAIAAISSLVEKVSWLSDAWQETKDNALAAWQLISETVGAVVKEIGAWFTSLSNELDITVGGWRELFNTVMDAIGTVVASVLDFIIGYWVTAYQFVTQAWTNAPQFFGNLGNSIANVFIAAIEWMVNKAIDKLNGLIGFANQAASLVGLSGIDKISNVSIDRKNDGGLADQVAGNFDRSYTTEFMGKVRARAAANRANAGSAGSGKSGSTKKSGAGGGKSGGAKKGGKKGGAGRSGREADPMREWQEEINAQKTAHETMRIEKKTHDEWNIAEELKFWQRKLGLVDANSKTGQKLQAKINELEKQLAKQTTEEKLQEIAVQEKAALHRLEMEADAADQALAMGKMTKLQRLDAEIEFEERRYEIAEAAMQQRIALAEQDPTYSQKAIDKLKRQAEELAMGHERKQGKNHDKREQQNRKDNPGIMDMLQDGGKNVWENAQQQLSDAFTAMLTRTQSFGQAMRGMFKSIGQTFIQEMVTKPLMAETGKAVRQTALYQMVFGQQTALQAAASAATVGAKTAETSAVVSANAAQAASGAAASQASIPYVGPILAVAAMGAMMAAVMGLLGGSGSSVTTTSTRIPSAAKGWDIPAGVNPLTQLHESEMVLPAEQANAVREMANGGGSGETIVINTTGGDFIHKRDLAKVLRQMKRDFKFT